MWDNILYGLLIGLLIVVCWFVWAYFIYRLSDERISVKIISKFNKSPDRITEAETKEYKLHVTDIILDPSRSGNVTAHIELVPLPRTTTAAKRGPFKVTYNLKDLAL